MAKPPKLADIATLSDFSHWVANAFQQAAGNENAGFVQISRYAGSEVTHRVVVVTQQASFVCSIEGGSE